MTRPAPIEVLYDVSPGTEIPLPDALREIHGPLRLPAPSTRPYVISNFVQSVDGVVTLDSGKSSGGAISGGNEHDRLTMGLLRSVADAVIVGAGTLRSVPKHIWTPQFVYPDLADEFAELRASLGKERYPLNVIVTGSGDLDPEFAILKQDKVPVLIVTTKDGAKKLAELPSIASVTVASDVGELTPVDILEAVVKATGVVHLLLEAGPKLMGQFLAERSVDELFLTVAPQIAGRDDPDERPGLVSDRVFAPDDPLWGTLVAVRRAESHLFLRYVLPTATA